MNAPQLFRMRSLALVKALPVSWVGDTRRKNALYVAAWRLFDVSASDLECWAWPILNEEGYPRSFVPGYSLAHRWAYEWMVGVIPVGLELDHQCNAPACVNPLHLKPMTRRENWARSGSSSAVRAMATACIHGHGYTAENTYYDRTGARHCRACHAERERERRRAPR